MLVLAFVLGASQFSHAQIQFGIKGGVNYNSNSIKEVATDVFNGAKSKTGFHAGVWTRFKIPVIGLYLRPELVYTQLSNEVTYHPRGGTAATTTYDFKKIDIPVLLGKKIFGGVGNIFIGPSFQYILSSNFGFNTLKEVKSSGFTAGLQFGAGIELGKIGLDVRWERSFSSIESAFVSSVASVDFDTRVNQIIVGLSYRF